MSKRKSVVQAAESDKYKLYRRQIGDVLLAHCGDIKATARTLGVSREWVRRWCKRLDITPSAYRMPPAQWEICLDGKKLGTVTATTKVRALAAAMVEFCLTQRQVERTTIKLLLDEEGDGIS